MNSIYLALTAIDRARDFAERFALDMAEIHRQRFMREMRDRYDYEIPSREEPWLPYDLAIMIHDYHNALERLRQQLLQAEWLGEEVKKPVPDQPLLPQIDEVVTRHTVRLAERIDRRLEHRRQRTEGVTHYIWHTEGDDRVRPDHAANDGKIFRWDDPPSTGHPGDDFNCRCRGEPIMANRGEPQELPQDQIAGGGKAAIEAIVDIIRRLMKTSDKLSKKLPKKPKKPKKPIDIFKRPKGVPKEWRKRATRKNDGVIYEKPGTKGATSIKIQKAKPESSNPGQRVDNVRWTRDGQSLDKNGNSVPKHSKESHIPFDDFQFKPEIFK